jgi:methyltransferase (TIGR00027 family)
MGVEAGPSETAMGAAILRFLAALDARKEIAGPDTLAEIFIPADRKAALKDPMIRQWAMKHRIPPGMYEFLIARTAFFDRVVKRALRENIPQIVFLGAGYDSRPYRFRELIRDTRIFEVDIQTTQQCKTFLLHQAGVVVPDSLVFVSVNLNTDDFGERLIQAGFDRNDKTLFVWEGVTPYLSASVVNETLRIIASVSPAGSQICFDHESRSSEILDHEDAKKIGEYMRSRHADEPVQFGIEQGEIGSFLSSRGFSLIEQLDAGEMERRYLTLSGGLTAGRIPPLFGLVLASVRHPSGEI